MSFPISFINRDGVGGGRECSCWLRWVSEGYQNSLKSFLNSSKKTGLLFLFAFFMGVGRGGGKSVGRGPLNNKRWPNLDWTLEALFFWDNLLTFAKLHCINVYCLNTNPNCTSGLTLLGDHLSKHIILTIMFPFLLRYSDDCGVVAIIYWFSWRETVFVFFLISSETTC